MKLSKKELFAFVAEQKRIFDIVRLVDVSMTIQYSILDDRTIKQESYQCYAVWNKNKRCENCVSAKAFVAKNQMTKFEFVENEIYFVVAIYSEIEDKVYVIELVSKLNDEVLFAAYGKNDFIDSIEAHNKRLYIDSLTGAYNRQYYDEQLKRLSHYNGIVMLDVDHLKTINDTYGHSAGDFVLKEVVNVVSAYIRPADAMIRLGGDEFLLAFREIPKDALAKRLESIRQTVCAIRTLTYCGLSVSVSMGAVYSDDSNADLVDLADQSLYQAKERRNKVVLKEV